MMGSGPENELLRHSYFMMQNFKTPLATDQKSAAKLQHKPTSTSQNTDRSICLVPGCEVWMWRHCLSNLSTWEVPCYVRDVRVWIWRQNLCVETVSSNLPAWATKRLCKMCIPVLTFEKTFGPITFEQIIGVQPNCYHGLPSSTACVLQKYDSQNLIVLAQRSRMCAWVRLSFPYYRVRISNPYIIVRGTLKDIMVSWLWFQVTSKLCIWSY